MINALILLHEATPPALQDRETLRYAMHSDRVHYIYTHARPIPETRIRPSRSSSKREMSTSIRPTERRPNPRKPCSVRSTLILVRLWVLSDPCCTLRLGPGYYVTSLAYGYGYAFMGATSPMETSFAMIAALIAVDTPRQIGWHLEGAIRNGATREEVRAVRAIAMQISKAAGIVWKNDIPDLI